jgi:hypothetical protein
MVGTSEPLSSDEEEGRPVLFTMWGAVSPHMVSQLPHSYREATNHSLVRGNLFSLCVKKKFEIKTHHFAKAIEKIFNDLTHENS